MQFDLSLLAPYTRDVLRAEPHANPFIAHFSKDKKNYIYVAADHSPGPSSPTFDAVDFVFARRGPQVVIVEGVRTEKGYSPEEEKALAAKIAATQFSGHSEPFYVIHQAMQRGIPFIGGEPTEPSIHKGLLESGMSTAEIQAFFLVYFTDPKQIGVTDWDGHARWVEDRVAHSDLFHHIPVQDRIDAAAFRAWYEQHQADVQGRPPWMLTHQDSAPFDDAGSSHFNRLSAKLTAVRDVHLNTLAIGLLEQYDDVMIVYGGGHLAQARPVLEAVFDGVTHIKLGVGEPLISSRPARRTVGFRRDMRSADPRCG